MSPHLCEPLSKGDSRAFYNYLKSKSRDGSQIESIGRVSTGVMLDDPVDIANELNGNFVSVFTTKSKSHKTKTEPLTNIKVDVEGVKRLIKSLQANKAVGPDLIGKQTTSHGS